MDEVKQVIVMRTQYPDGKGGHFQLRKGKLIAQGAHASSMWMRERLLNSYSDSKNIYLTGDELSWLNEFYTKITLQVNSEEELEDIYNKAKVANLLVYMVTDLGKTAFDGVPTKTALAIGPHKSSLIDPITKELKLF
jgi:peptidyl-tRNA hydrolase, PTH2 family